MKKIDTVLTNVSGSRLFISALFLAIVLFSTASAQPQFEFCNNFLMNLSFITGTDRGMEQNLEDNLGWMTDQGYTHLRFFGIFPNHVHCFPSPTLDANGYPQSTYHEPVLELLVTKAQDHNITVNFDGWEIIAEANYDTLAAGVNYISVEELGDIVEEVLALGVNLISEEQFGSGYIQEIQSVCASMGADHETTSALWWQGITASSIADMQLGNFFSFYPYSQSEVDAFVLSGGHTYSLPSNMGTLHYILESSKYFNVPISVAVGSFGILDVENWRNALRFVQLQHQPNRFSIEEQNTSFMIWEPGFNFMAYVGDDLTALGDTPIGDRPTVNLVIDASSIYIPSFIPSWFASLVNAAAIVNTFTSQGYKVVATIDSVMPEADAYYVLLAGGTGAPDLANLPDYVQPLLESSKVVFLQPTYGIPDDNDGGGWTPLREYFGLPSGETATMADAIPETVVYNELTVGWGGVELNLTPCLEQLRATDINISQASIALSATVGADETALILQNGNKFLINSNLVNIEASYIFSSLLDGAIRQPAGADIVIANEKCLIFTEYDTDVEVDLPWSGEYHLTRYDPDGYVVSDRDTIIAGTYSATLSRGELVILIAPSSFICGDVNVDENVNLTDILDLISYVYVDPIGEPEPVPVESGDVNSDLDINLTDILDLIAHIYVDPIGEPVLVCP